MISRRKFIAISKLLGLSAILPAVHSSCNEPKEIKGGIVGANANLGHRLRNINFELPTETIKTNIVIIGGGVSGLSAARFLKKHTNDFLLLEMEDTVGGNAVGGKNEVSHFPWGAHYLPIPGNNDPELISFLSEANVITGIENGLPVFNEYYLCHDPKERLFIHNLWQEGIVPHEGVPVSDRAEIQRFLVLMNDFKIKIGKDNRRAFTIPLEQSSQDSELLNLDTISASTFLAEHNFSSPYLHWYINYCCADDFGSSIADTSAWAMIHYFASRNSKAKNASSDSVLTWPEGNFWLIKQLTNTITENIVSGALVYEVTTSRNGVVCSYFDVEKNVTKRIEAKAAIMATPQFVNQRILKELPRNIDYTKFEYTPWVVANITVNHPLNERRGEGLCWDNVIYGSESLGYVNASHQSLTTVPEKKVITFYKPLTTGNAVHARKKTFEANYKDWRDMVVKELKKPHPDIEQHVEDINIWLWGHGMIKPSPNFIWSENRRLATSPIQDKIFFAHSDISGMSLFEEAFYQGHKAASMALKL